MILGGHTRSAVAFARLLPGVTTGGDDDKLNFNTRINGGTNETDEALLDGVSIVDGSLGQNGIELAVTGHPMSPEAIQEDFPLLKRSQIYGAIAFYLDHQPEIDKYLEDTMREFEGNAIPLEQANPTLWAKIQRAKAEAAQGEPRS